MFEVSFFGSIFRIAIQVKIGSIIAFFLKVHWKLLDKNSGVGIHLLGKVQTQSDVQ